MSIRRRVFDSALSSLRLKVTLGVVLPLLVILGVFTGLEYARHRTAVLANLSFLAGQIGQVIEDGIRHEMLSENLDGLQHMLDAISQNDAIRIVYLLDTSGRVVFAPRRDGVGSMLDNRAATCQPCHRLPADQRPASVVVTLPDQGRVFRSMTPIANRPECQTCHGSEQRLIGVLLTDISMAPMEAMLASDLRENILWWLGVILITIVVVNAVMSRLVVRRLASVAAALGGFGRGRRDLRLPAGSPDEIGQLAQAFNVMGQRVQAEEGANRLLSENLRREAAQRRELLKRLITAQEEERRRVARDLHDGLGQDLGGLAVGLEAAERLLSSQPEQARARLQQARALIGETTARAYDMILSLRPSALDDLGLAAAIRAHAARALRNTGVEFELDAAGLSPRLPAEIEVALFRSFQEALTNVTRHAGARRVRVSLAVRDGMFEGEIADDGRGFDLEDVQALQRGRADGECSPRGLGLLGMQERVAQCSGALEIHTRPGAGTRLLIRVPLPKRPDD